MSSTAYIKAVDLLHHASTAKGFTASVHPEDNYQRVWTRDSALCGIAALSTNDERLTQTFKKSIETIFAHQHMAGFIPSNVPVNTEAVSYGNVVGRVDNHAWIIISACSYAQLQNNIPWLQQFKSGIRRCIDLMSAWEFNGRGLMYVPQSADWADEYHHHGYVLYNQLLRLWALKCAAACFKDIYYQGEAERVQSAIEMYFEKESYATQVDRMTPQETKQYWPMGFNPSKFYNQFDLQANALALLLNIGSKEMQTEVIQYISQHLSSNDLMIPSFSPPVADGDSQMNELRNNYAFRFRNFPFEFHNGGLWSVWNGFMALCIAPFSDNASKELNQRIAAACAQNNWEFNECHHGRTGKPIGVPFCAWSAAGLILGVNHSFSTQLCFFNE